jgi:hypothetical protein
MDYEQQAQSFADRIEAAISNHPEILTMSDPFKLFKVPGLDCSNVDTFMQASAALALAQTRWKERNT